MAADKVVKAYYDALASNWDDLYGQKPFYRKGFRFVDKWRLKSGLSKDVWDAACGTGLLLALFKKAGYRVQGSDLSPNMVLRARKKLGTSVRRGDYRGIRLRNSVSVALSFFNSFAYCTSLRELGAAFSNVGAQLRPGGILVFDLVTTKRSAMVRSVVKRRSLGSVVYRFHLGVPKGRRFVSFFVHVLSGSSGLKVTRAQLVRGMFSKTEVLRLIRKAGLVVRYSGSGYMGRRGLTVFVVQKPRLHQ